MASILRSSKFVRYIGAFARNVVINTPREFDGNFVNTTPCLCGAIPRSYCAQTATQHEKNLEQSLKRIDQDVRKSGRISRRDIEDVLEEIRNTRSATTSQSLLVIRCCGNLVPEELPEVRTKLVQEIWNTLKKLEIPMDISHYNALLRVYLENEHPFSPTEFLAELENNQIEPNRVTYQRLIARYCQDGDIEGAAKILEFMREKQLPVNENVFNTLIIGHSQAGDMVSAHGILNVMAQAGLEPSADTYTTLLCSYAKVGDIDAIKKIIDECDTKEVYLLDKDFLDVTQALVLNGHKEHVPFILSKVRKAIGYNQDAINVIYGLTNKGHEDSAFEILQSMVRNESSEGNPLPSGGFFIKQLVKANRPLESIIQICERMEQSNLNDRSFVIALESALQYGNDKVAFPLLEELKKRGHDIRQHYFWPLIKAKAGDKDNDNVLKVLSKMIELGITPNSETTRDYIIPSLKGKSSVILKTLRDANISVGSSASCLVQHLLQKNEIKEAAFVTSTVTAFYAPELIRRPLTLSFYKTRDVNSYISLIREVYENLNRKPENDTRFEDKSDAIGFLIADLGHNNKIFLETIEIVLEQLVEQGLSISTKWAEKIQDKLADKINDKLSSLLGSLTSGELIPVPQVKKPPTYTPSSQMNIAQLEKLIENLESKKQNVKGLKRQLLTLYYRAKDLKKTEALLDVLEQQKDFVYTSGIYAQLLDLYAFHDNLEKALYYFNKLKELEGDEFALDESKLVRLVSLMYKEGRVEEGLKLLEETPRETKEMDKSFTFSSMVWRFLNLIAEEGKVEDLDKFFAILIKRDFIKVSNVLLGPLIKVHLVNNDLNKALEKFEYCVTTYRATPWKNELTCKLIQSEDAEKLQKLTDLSTTVHGEINSLYDLVFSFVECGRIRQARKILETPGLQNRAQRINDACERYQQEGKVKSLEGLKDATKDLNHIDRSDIYYQLLLSYIKQNETDKALGLWTQMQEEDLPPSEEFLRTLGVFLKEQGIEVPFTVPDLQEIQQKKIVRETVVKTPLQIFRQKLKAKEALEAYQARKTIQNKWNLLDASELVEVLTQQNLIKEASDVVLEMLEKKMVPINRVFKYFINKLAIAGDINLLQNIGDRINTETKKVISFDNRLCHANLVAGKSAEYLDMLYNEINRASTPEEIRTIGEKFPRGGAYGILDQNPELVDKFEELAKLYLQKDIVAPLNILWTHYFITGNYEKAEQIWSEHLKTSPRIMFQRVVQTARDKKDINLITKLIEHLKLSNVTEGALGNAYSCMLDIAAQKETPENVATLFEETVKNVNINSLNRTAVLRVKDIFDKLGKPFNFALPLKNPKQSSSSSSDEAAKEKKR